MTRLPVFVRDHLLLLDTSDLDIMAEKADKLVNDRKRRYQHQDLSSPQSQNISSRALQDIVKRLSEVVAIQEKQPTHSCNLFLLHLQPQRTLHRILRIHTCRRPLLLHTLNLLGLPLTHKCLLVIHTLSHVVLTHAINLLLLALYIHNLLFLLFAGTIKTLDQMLVVVHLDANFT